MVLLANSLEFIVSCFAVWKAGAILVPEDPAIKRENLSHILRDARPGSLIVERNIAEGLDTVAELVEGVRVVFVKDRTFALSGLNHIAVESLDAILESESAVDVTRVAGGQSHDVASITYTSGSTGAAQGSDAHERELAGGSVVHAGLPRADAAGHDRDSVAAAPWGWRSGRFWPTC